MSPVPVGEVNVRLPGWGVVYARAASILGMFFGLLGIMLMIAGAPKTPIPWSSFWEAVAVVILSSGVFVWSTAPMLAPQDATNAASHGVASATPVVDTAAEGNDLADVATPNTSQSSALAASAVDRADDSASQTADAVAPNSRAARSRR